MVTYAEQLAREAGLTTVRLYTNQRFEENLRLYASLGFEVEREETLNGGVAVHMMKAVAYLSRFTIVFGTVSVGSVTQRVPSEH